MSDKEIMNKLFYFSLLFLATSSFAQVSGIEPLTSCDECTDLFVRFPVEIDWKKIDYKFKSDSGEALYVKTYLGQYSSVATNLKNVFGMSTNPLYGCDLVWYTGVPIEKSSNLQVHISKDQRIPIHMVEINKFDSFTSVTLFLKFKYKNGESADASFRCKSIRPEVTLAHFQEIFKDIELSQLHSENTSSSNPTVVGDDRSSGKPVNINEERKFKWPVSHE
jgi:hypothetical protein